MFLLFISCEMSSLTFLENYIRIDISCKLLHDSHEMSIFSLKNKITECHLLQL